MYGPYPVYPNAGINPPHAPAVPLEWFCPESRQLTVIAEIDEGALREVLSYTPFAYATNRAQFALMRLKGHTLTSPDGYYEAAVAVPVRYEDALYVHQIYMYCDNATAIIAGREVFGQPKKDGLITLSEEGDRIRGGVAREGVTLFELDFTADPTAPEAALTPGATIAGSIHERRVPLVDRPGDAYRDITLRANYRREVRQTLRGRATMTVGESRWDPIDRLKPRVVAASFTVQSFGGHFHEETRKILKTWTPG